MILDIYRGCFERVYIFSPSIHVDQTWEPVKQYLNSLIKSNNYHDPYKKGSVSFDIAAGLQKATEFVIKERISKYMYLLQSKYEHITFELFLKFLVLSNTFKS